MENGDDDRFVEGGEYLRVGGGVLSQELESGGEERFVEGGENLRVGGGVLSREQTNLRGVITFVGCMGALFLGGVCELLGVH